MQPIIAPISREEPQQDRADIIRNLHDGLLTLLHREVIKVGKEERESLEAGLQGEHVYNDITQQLVILFQEQHNSQNPPPQTHPDLWKLRVNGNIDVRTADAMNTKLARLGVLKEETLEPEESGGMMEDPVKLSQLAFTARGEEVKSLHDQLSRVGMVLPVNEKTQSVFGAGTQQAVSEFQAKNKLDVTGILNEETRAALHSTVETLAQPRRVEGRIILENGLPAGKIKLRVVNKGIGDQTAALGEVETDDLGFYALSYDIPGGSANVEVQAVDPSGSTVKLSNPKLNAERNEVLNLVAPTSLMPRMNEFQMLAADLVKAVGPDLGKLATLRESPEQPDISSLHQETRWDAKLIGMAALAAKASETTGVAHDALYGAFRAGLPFEPEALAEVSPEAFATALTRAKEAGVISLDDAKIGAANTAFESFQIGTQRQAIVPGTVSSLSDILDRAPIKGTQKETFEKLVLKTNGDKGGLWREAKAQGIPDNQIAALQLQGKLAYLTLNNAPLMEALQKEITSQDELVRLVQMDLYQDEEWVKRLKILATDTTGLNQDKLGKVVPAAYQQASIDDRLTAYADDMAAKVRRTYPTHVVCRMLEKGDLKLGTRHDELRLPVKKFLKNSLAKGFQLGQTSVSSFVQQHADIAFEGITEDQKDLAVIGVKLLARTYQMTPDDESMIALLELGFTSGKQVTAVPKEDFIRQYGARLGSRKIAELIWNKSMQIVSVTFNIYTLGKKIGSAPPVQAISGGQARLEAGKDNLKSLLKSYPTMDSLFGSTDFCECEHCRSVLSPAAYFVDLLQFVDPPEQEWQHVVDDWNNKHSKAYSDGNFLKPYDALMLRRPDLPHVPLTCENTNTAVPYIDLVNEILEYFVAHKGLDDQAAHDTGQATSAELMAEPQRIIPEAYDILKKARYPLHLPFDLWVETVRQFCAYFDTPFWKLLDIFRTSDDLLTTSAKPQEYTRADILAEFLGITPDEYGIYTALKLESWLELYGFDKPADSEAAALKSLRSATITAHRLGVSYRELAEVLQTGFVNPRLAKLEILRKLGVTIHDVFRYKKQGVPSPLTQDQQDEALSHESEFERRLADVTEKFKSLKPKFDAKQWINKAWEDHEFEQIIVLQDQAEGSSFEQTTLGYAGSPAGANLSRLDYVKLNLFVRLWKRLGWTIEETDRALTAFTPEKEALNESTLGSALKTALICLAHLKELDGLLGPSKKNKLNLLPLWNTLSIGANSLYAQLFLERQILKEDPIFDHPLGEYLSKPDVLLKDHLPALQSALRLTADDIEKILQDDGSENDRDITKAALSLVTVSKLYRYGILAKALAISVGDLVALKSITGLNPFPTLDIKALGNSESDYPVKQTIEFVHLTVRLKRSGFSISDLDYLVRHRFDSTTTYAKDDDATLAWLIDLSSELRPAVNNYAIPDDITDDVLREKLLLVFSPEVVEKFFAFWLMKAELAAASTKEFEAFFLRNFEGFLSFEDFFGTAEPATQAKKRSYLLGKILPYLQIKVIRKTVMQALVTKTEGDKTVIETLLTNRDVIFLPESPTRSLLAQFENLAHSGLTATFTFSDPSRAPLVKTMQDVAVMASDKCREASWRGFLQVPDSGVYRFYAALEKPGAGVDLRLGTISGAILDAQAKKPAQAISGVVELKSGVPYAFTLKATNLQDGSIIVNVKGDAGPKDSVGRFTIVPHASLEGAKRAYTLLSKALKITQTLGLSEADVRQLSKTDAGTDKLSWELLPTQRSEDPSQEAAQATKFFRGIKRLLTYAALKQELAGGTEEWAALFEQARRFENGGEKSADSIAELCKSIASMTRRKPETVEAAAAELKMTSVAHFRDENRLERLWEVLQTIEKFGISVFSTTKWLTREPDVHIAMDVRNMVKSRYESETWQRIAKAIFDPLRMRQRDALVAYIMHLKDDLTSVEKLFEYFLIDPGTEPVVQTSRLRLAISSLQTFIQRCFLNLEAQVPPAVLNAAHWSWMKRYRVWEANRKIFLFPENWLEPEWRDDKTHLYKELEGTLLQGDVTTQLAEDALFVYLRKLDQLARLEIVTMYAEEHTFGPPTMHVIGRTYAAPHQYFYRRYDRQMWTPWEPVTAEIDGDHLTVVMWQERVHLFWLTFLEKVEESTPGATSAEPPTKLWNVGVDNLAALGKSQSVMKRSLDIQLNWSEYLNGEWTVRQSSGFITAVDKGWTGFRSGQQISFDVFKETDPVVGQDGAVWISVYGLFGRDHGPQPVAFRMVSKNSRPNIPQVHYLQKRLRYPSKYDRSVFTSPSGLSFASEYANPAAGSGSLSVTFVSEVVTTDGQTNPGGGTLQNVLLKTPGYSLLSTSNLMKFPNAEFASLISPVFYADDLYTFFVEPSVTETTVDRWEGYSIPPPSQKSKWEDYVAQSSTTLVSTFPHLYIDDTAKASKRGEQFGVTEELSTHSLNTNSDPLTRADVGMQFGDVILSSTGRVKDLSEIQRVVTAVDKRINRGM